MKKKLFYWFALLLLVASGLFTWIAFGASPSFLGLVAALVVTLLGAVLVTVLWEDLRRKH